MCSRKRFRSKDSKENVSEYMYFLSLCRQAACNEMIAQFLIKNINQTFELGNDVGTALKKLEELNTQELKLSLSVSTTENETVRLAGNRLLETELKANFNLKM
jgi:hypothetical protein